MEKPLARVAQLANALRREQADIEIWLIRSWVLKSHASGRHVRQINGPASDAGAEQPKEGMIVTFGKRHWQAGRESGDPEQPPSPGKLLQVLMREFFDMTHNFVAEYNYLVPLDPPLNPVNPAASRALSIFAITD